MTTESQTIEVSDEPAVTLETVTPPPETTAAPEGEPKQAETKSFTQAELDEIIQKEKAKAEAKAERRALKAYRETLERFAPQQTTQSEPDGKPTRAAFNGNDEAYVEALTDWKIGQRDKVQQAQAQETERSTRATKTENLYKEAEKLSGFDRDGFNSVLEDYGTPTIAQAISDSDVGPQLMAWMNSNPDDVARISKLSPVRQAAEIGRLEAKLSVVKAAKELPTPIKTVAGTGSVTNGDPSKMSMDDYMAMRKKQGASWAR